MENLYLEKITTLLKSTQPKLFTLYKIEFKNVFGAVGGYVKGKIFISCGKFGIALKLPREVLDNIFKEKNIKHLKYFPKGHVKKDYVVLPNRILNNKKNFGKLLDQSIKFVKK